MDKQILSSKLETIRKLADKWKNQTARVEAAKDLTEIIFCCDVIENETLRKEADDDSEKESSKCKGCGKDKQAKAGDGDSGGSG